MNWRGPHFKLDVNRRGWRHGYEMEAITTIGRIIYISHILLWAILISALWVLRSAPEMLSGREISGFVVLGSLILYGSAMLFTILLSDRGADT